MSNGKFETAEVAFTAIGAGRATFTFRSVKTGTRFTYKMTQPKDAHDARRFVAVLTGTNNETDFTYIGMVGSDGRFRTTRGTRNPEAPSVKGFAWGYAQLAAGKLPETLEVWHTGRCGRCNRLLTTPESVARGIGPECASQMGL